MIWTPRVTVAAVITQDENYLLVEEKPARMIVFNQPAGHLENGESLIDAVIREVLEETARDFQPLGLIGIYRYPLPAQQRVYLRFCFAGTVSERIAGRALDQPIIATHWLSRAQIESRQNQLRSPMVLQNIDDYLTRPLTPLEILHDVI